MFEITTLNAFMMMFTAVCLVAFVSYRAGELRSALALTPQVCERPHEKPVVDPYAHIPVSNDWDIRRRPFTPIGEGMEPVIVLGTFGGHSSDLETIQQLRDQISVLEDDLLTVGLARDFWHTQAARKDLLRARYLRLLRGERARLGYMLGEVMDAPRRPAKAKLAAVVLELPRGRHLSLVPPLVASEWRAA